MLFNREQKSATHNSCLWKYQTFLYLQIFFNNSLFLKRLLQPLPEVPLVDPEVDWDVVLVHFDVVEGAVEVEGLP